MLSVCIYYSHYMLFLACLPYPCLTDCYWLVCVRSVSCKCFYYGSKLVFIILGCNLRFIRFHESNVCILCCYHTGNGTIHIELICWSVCFCRTVAFVNNSSNISVHLLLNNREMLLLISTSVLADLWKRWIN